MYSKLTEYSIYRTLELHSILITILLLFKIIFEKHFAK